MAIKHTNIWGSEVNVDWEVLSISSEGILDWSSAKWGGIAKQEEYFGQDLNGDGGVGLTAALNTVSFDITGSKLLKDSENSLYIDVDGDISTTNDIISIVDDYGWSPSFDYSDNWQGGSHKSESYAVQQQQDDSFKLAIKKTDNWGQEDHVNWEVLSISSNGVLDWQSSHWGGIAKYEKFFEQDLNGDGGIGLSASLVHITTDVYGSSLKRDIDNSLYIDIDGDNATTDDIVSITDTWGGSPSFDYSDEWSNQWGSGSSKSESYAVEKLPDGSFSLAIKRTDKYVDDININWEILQLSAEGVIDWNATQWTSGIAKYEDVFGQDLNGDGGKGLLASLSVVNSDITGSLLLKDSDNNLYIDVDGDISNNEDIIPVIDSYGGSPHFDHADSWGSGSFKSESIAVEKQSDGTFSLAVKKTDKFVDYNGIPETHINWEVVSIASDGTVDWNNTIWGGIVKQETKFNQDLNLDGGIGLTASLTAVSTDTTGDLLMRDADNALYISVGGANATDQIISITDEWGGAPTFEFEDSWSGNSHKSESVAVELQDDGSYKLAIKKTDDWGDGEHINWEVLTTDSN